MAKTCYFPICYLSQMCDGIDYLFQILGIDFIECADFRAVDVEDTEYFRSAIGFSAIAYFEYGNYYLGT